MFFLLDFHNSVVFDNANPYHNTWRSHTDIIKTNIPKISQFEKESDNGGSGRYSDIDGERERETEK